MDTPPLRAWIEHDGAMLRLRLARPKANIVDAAMIDALQSAFDSHRGDRGLLAVLLDAEGPHFSFGASVEEHLAERCAQMLAGLHRLLDTMLAFPAPVLVAVRGMCLGGGLEVALAASRIFAAPDAQFGQPEIRLGVFAPAASCLLPFRMNQPAAEDMLLTGRNLSGGEALAAGLVQQVADDPLAAANDYFAAHLAGRSAAALACAMSAARVAYLPQVRSRLAEVERIYLEQLMRTHDANEGLAAFIAKRTPNWEHR
jgi:cyclohexa-1,5-dienecarbonyl-CoA hydratase